jgi:hypothetical protein
MSRCASLLQLSDLDFDVSKMADVVRRGEKLRQTRRRNRNLWQQNAPPSSSSRRSVVEAPPLPRRHWSIERNTSKTIVSVAILLCVCAFGSIWLIVIALLVSSIVVFALLRRAPHECFAFHFVSIRPSEKNK